MSDVLIIPIEQRIASGPALVNGNAVFLLIRTLRRFPDDDWHCAEEEAALFILTPGGDFTLSPVPLRLPSHRTGAAGAERAWAFTLLFDGNLLISLRSPFFDQRGWGTENFVVAWNPDGNWLALERTASNINTYPLAAPIRESELPSWGYGELVLWKDKQERLRSMNDLTPYHVEGVDSTIEVRRMLAVAARSDRGWTSLRLPTYAQKSPGLTLYRGRKTIRLSALEKVLCEPRWAFRMRDPAILGGVELADGSIAVALRSCEYSPRFPMEDAIALITKSV